MHRRSDLWVKRFFGFFSNSRRISGVTVLAVLGEEIFGVWDCKRA